MTEEIKVMINKLYQKAYEKPLEVYEVFKDYFDEDRVDIQEIHSLEFFTSWIKTMTYSRFITTRASILKSEKFESYDEVNQEIIKTLLSEHALPTKITSDYTVFKYLFPFLYDAFTISDREACVLVHFPEVRVTNEYDKFIDIKDLYAKVKVRLDGRISGTFTLARTDYPLSHIRSHYMHSHVPGTDYPNFKFLSPCLGTGPINNTILSLTEGCDLNLWMLFCHELNTYVKVESINGGPYYRLENVTVHKLHSKPDNFNGLPSRFKHWFSGSMYNYVIRGFIRFIINENTIKFNYSEGSYNLAMDRLDFIIALSNAFIYYINNNLERTEHNLSLVNLDNLLASNILKYYIIKNRKIYTLGNSQNTTNYLENDGQDAFMFKGNMLKMHIYDDTVTESSENKVLLLDYRICESLLYVMITYLNTVYGAKDITTEIGTSKKFFIL